MIRLKVTKLFQMQVANWGCGNESVLDAVSLAEQYAITKGQYSRGAWQLFLRKDLMEPSLRPSDDKVATDLIYHQILGGVREEEYICNKVNSYLDVGYQKKGDLNNSN